MRKRLRPVRSRLRQARSKLKAVAAALQKMSAELDVLPKRATALDDALATLVRQAQAEKDAALAAAVAAAAEAETETEPGTGTDGVTEAEIVAETDSDMPVRRAGEDLDRTAETGAGTRYGDAPRERLPQFEKRTAPAGSLSLSPSEGAVGLALEAGAVTAPQKKTRKRKRLMSMAVTYLLKVDRHLPRIFEITTIVLLAGSVLLAVVVYFRVQWLWRQDEEDKL